MEFDLNAFAKEVHEIALAHGWWEKKPSNGTILALIHSEWSEALEEYRNGKSNAYCVKECGAKDCECVRHCRFESYAQKPEGIAVEIADGCIRILDLFGAIGHTIADGDLKAFMKRPLAVCGDVPELICELHAQTADGTLEGLETALLLGIDGIYRLGLDAVMVLEGKSEYNKTRPYRHGNKVC